VAGGGDRSRYLQNPGVQKAAFVMKFSLSPRAALGSRVTRHEKGPRRRGIAPAKASVIPNGVDTRPVHTRREERVHQSLKKSDYGRRLPWNVKRISRRRHALALLEKLQSIATFASCCSRWFCRSGFAKTAVTQRGLSNALFLRAPSRRDMPGLIASADFCLALVKPGPFSRWLLSSKIFMYMGLRASNFRARRGRNRQGHCRGAVRHHRRTAGFRNR